MSQRITASDLIKLSPKHANFVIEYVKDFMPRRAAVAAGFAPETGSKLLKRDDIAAVIDNVMAQRLAATDIDAEWHLMEAVDNHLIARQSGNISASNTALTLIGKHKLVDSFAAEKVDIYSDNEVMERLTRGRKRMNENNDDDTSDSDTVPSFL